MFCANHFIFWYLGLKAHVLCSTPPYMYSTSPANPSRPSSIRIQKGRNPNRNRAAVPSEAQMAIVAAAAKRMLRTPIAIPVRFCSKVPIPASPAVPPAISKAFEDFVSYLKAPKMDLVRASLLNEEIGKVLKNAPPEIALVQIRSMVEEMARLCEGSTVETRLTKIEVGHEFDRRFGFGVYTSFAALLVGIPFAIYAVSTTGKNERAETMNAVEALKGRLAEVEKAISTSPPNCNNERAEATDNETEEPLKKLEDEGQRESS